MVLLFFKKAFNAFYPGIKYLFYVSNNPKKKDLSLRDLFKINLDKVLPCFHLNKLIPPTHNINITPKY